MSKDKIFHDTVHGNIRISEDYCKKIIDTLLFQRLRRIEQSSVRSLYPCARHDRFIHSIGVFHVGTRIVEWVEHNTKLNKDVWDTIAASWEKVTVSYLLACLLHDVGHAPFSHTFEKYYDLGQGNLLDSLLNKAIADSEFAIDLEISPDAKQHEKVSAYLLATHFKCVVNEMKGDVQYAARMIIGCRYNDDNDIEKQLVNCFVSVLHGEVDADRLDYAVRDQWAAGFSSGRIDIERIMRSMLIVRDSKIGNKLRMCFTKGAINSIEGLSQIKDFQKKWVFRHQNVVYDQHILSAALERVAELYKPDKTSSYEDMLRYIFNVKIFEDRNYLMPEGLCLYLLSDDTIIQMLRRTLQDNPFAEEWLSRQYKKKPLWKTPAEYEGLFSHNKSVMSKEKIVSLLNRNGYSSEDYYLEEVEYAPYVIPENQVWFWINNDTVDASRIVPGTTDKPSTIYYIYLDSVKIGDKSRIIEELKKIS